MPDHQTVFCSEPAEVSRVGTGPVSPPLRIMVAPNGARRGKGDHPALPVSIAEIAETARSCHLAGAHSIHLHVRDENGAHSLDPGRYREAIAAVHEAAPGMGIQITTEAASQFDVSTQFDTLRKVVPEAASVSVREVMHAPEIAPHLYAFASEAGTAVQHILYDVDDIALLGRMRDEGIVKPTQSDVILVLGRYNPPRLARVSELAPLVVALEPWITDWTVCAFGATEHAVALQAINMGGHVRVGFENNLCRPDGTPATDNAENVARIVQAAQTAGRALLDQDIET